MWFSRKANRAQLEPTSCTVSLWVVGGLIVSPDGGVGCKMGLGAQSHQELREFQKNQVL